MCHLELLSPYVQNDKHACAAGGDRKSLLDIGDWMMRTTDFDPDATTGQPEECCHLTFFFPEIYCLAAWRAGQHCFQACQLASPS
jgi:hypothetical protein